MSMACGQGSTIKGIPDNVRDYIQLVGNRADVKFDTLSRKKIPQELYDNEGVLISFMLHSYASISLRTHAHSRNRRHVEQCHQENSRWRWENLQTQKIKATRE